MMTAEYTDINSLQHSAEELPEGIESTNYSTKEILPPGNYLSQSREITVKPSVDKRTKEPNGHFTFTITFKGGLIDENGRIWARNGFEKTWASTKPFERFNQPGKTSGVAEYLRACGLNPKEIGSSIAALKEAMLGSQNTPVSVYVTRTNQGAKDPVTGEYGKEFLKQRDFNVGTPEAPVWATEVVKDGVTYTARHKFKEFRKAR